jgi:putative endonuclease
MLFSVYILLSLKDNKLYVGQTDNFERRIKEHNSGKVYSTKNRRPLIVLHGEEFSNRAIAMRREVFLKSLYSARFKQKLKKEYLMKIG